MVTIEIPLMAQGKMNLNNDNKPFDSVAKQLVKNTKKNVLEPYGRISFRFI